jgi:hypothetical protein
MKTSKHVSLASDLVYDALGRYQSLYGVYRWLERHIGTGDRAVNPTNNTIAFSTGLHRNTIARALQVLQGLGLIRIEYLDPGQTQRLIVLDFWFPDAVRRTLEGLHQGIFSLDLRTGTLHHTSTPGCAGLALLGGQGPYDEAAAQHAFVHGVTAPQASPVADSDKAYLGENPPYHHNRVGSSTSTSQYPTAVLEQEQCTTRASGVDPLPTLVRPDPLESLILDLRDRYQFKQAARRPGIVVNRPVWVRIEEIPELIDADQSASDTLGLAKSLFAYWQLKLEHPKARLTRKLTDLIRVRLKRYTIEQLQHLVDAIAESEWHRGKNPQNRPYDDLARNLRDEQKIEWWLAKPTRARPADARQLGQGLKQPEGRSLDFDRW